MPDREEEFRERLLTAHRLHEDPADALVMADYFQERGDLPMTASALDRAFGLDPTDKLVAERRSRTLDKMTLTEHGICFRYIPAGSFLMGSDFGDEDEKPVHPVRLQAYWISETPISWASYCMNLGWKAPPNGTPDEDLSEGFALSLENRIRLQYCENETFGARDWHSHVPPDPDADPSTPRGFGSVDRDDTTLPFEYDQKPMIAVSWQSAEELAKHMSTPHVVYRLPTEPEWERAARGGRIQNRFSWGDDPPSGSNCDFDRFADFFIRRPKSLPPNDYGLYGMCGGVAEWTSDLYDRLAYDIDATTPDRPDADPIERVVRGGSWADCAGSVTVSFRASLASGYWREPDVRVGGHRTPNIGFRLVRMSPT